MRNREGRRRGRRIPFAIALVAGLAVPRSGAAQDVGLPIGTMPDAARVEDLEGNAVDLAQFMGSRPVLIEFWATWCPLCKALEPRLQAAHEKYGDRVDFLIVGVGVNQTPRQIRRYLEEHPATGPVFYDARGAAVRAYRVPTTSYVVILDASGKVTYTGTGEDQPIMETLETLLGSQDNAKATRPGGSRGLQTDVAGPIMVRRGAGVGDLDIQLPDVSAGTSLRIASPSSS